MRIVEKTQDQAILDLSRRELLAVNNALNEVCHGPDTSGHGEFHARMGVQPGEAKALLDEIGAGFA